MVIGPPGQASPAPELSGAIPTAFATLCAQPSAWPKTPFLSFSKMIILSEIPSVTQRSLFFASFSKALSISLVEVSGIVVGGVGKTGQDIMKKPPYKHCKMD